MCIGMPLSHTLPSLICDIDTVVVDGQLVGQEGESSASSRGFDSQTSNGLTQEKTSPTAVDDDDDDSDEDADIESKIRRLLEKSNKKSAGDDRDTEGEAGREELVQQLDDEEERLEPGPGMKLVLAVLKRCGNHLLALPDLQHQVGGGCKYCNQHLILT